MVKNGYEVVVWLLLKVKVDIDVKGDYYGSNGVILGSREWV